MKVTTLFGSVIAMAAFATAIVVPEAASEEVSVLGGEEDPNPLIEARKSCSGGRLTTETCGGKLLRPQNSFHNCGNQGGKCCASNKDGTGGINVNVGKGSEACGFCFSKKCSA